MDLSKLIKSTLASIPSPYFGKPNLAISFTRETGAYTTDSAGNQRPVKETVTVKASVRTDDRNPVPEAMGGAGQYQVYLLGRFISPKIPPAGINLESPAIATLSDGLTTITQTGELRLMPVTQHRFPEVTSHLGYYFEAVFMLRGAV